MRSSLIILSFFATGLLLGLVSWLPESLPINKISFYVLCALMFSVGFSIGHDKNTIRKFKKLSPQLLFLPIMTVVGTFAGGLFINIFIKERTIAETLAISSGFGYYSLSSIMITQYKGVELGTIALMANIIRELLTLLFAPGMVKYFGNLAPISAGGATTMDTTFPVIVKNSEKQFGIVSIYHGFIMDFSVPFLVTLFCGM